VNEYSKGGYVPARGELPRVVVRENHGRKEYWDPFEDAWVPVLTMAEWKALKDGVDA